MIKIMLKRRKEGDTYLAVDSGSTPKRSPAPTLASLIPSPPLLTPNPPILYTNSNVKKSKAFYIGETGQLLSKRVNGHCSTCTVVNSDLPVPIYTHPTSSLSRNAGPFALFINSQIPPLTTSAANMKRHINLF